MRWKSREVVWKRKGKEERGRYGEVRRGKGLGDVLCIVWMRGEYSVIEEKEECSEELECSKTKEVKDSAQMKSNLAPLISPN